jgi:hypothetical protein
MDEQEYLWLAEKSTGKNYACFIQCCQFSESVSHGDCVLHERCGVAG